MNRVLTLAVAFLGWLWAGMHMSTTQLAGQPAAIDLLARNGQLNSERYQSLNQQTELSAADKAELQQAKEQVGRWFAWFQCSFLFGAAAGGLVLGKLGDRVGRARAMSLSILIYAVFAGLTGLAQAPWQLCAWWFLACTGVGGMWPNGVALVSEVWSGLSRPAIAGVIGTAANVGLFLMATLGKRYPLTPESWRWVMVVGTLPVALAVVSFLFVPESPRWLAARGLPAAGTTVVEDSVFRPPLLWITLVAILLGTIPMIGGWGTANWMIPWAGEAPDPALKAQVAQMRALTGIVGSLLGGWIAGQLGRRLTYFLVSLLSLAVAQYMFRFLVPLDRSFLFWVGVLGFLSGIYFGWLPLCLPEMFPTRVRSTGAGLGFNFGRILTAVTVFTTGALIALFDGDYARIGQFSSLFFILGIAGIWLAPDTGSKPLDAGA